MIFLLAEEILNSKDEGTKDTMQSGYLLRKILE